MNIEARITAASVELAQQLALDEVFDSLEYEGNLPPDYTKGDEITEEIEQFLLSNDVYREAYERYYDYTFNIISNHLIT